MQNYYNSTTAVVLEFAKMKGKQLFFLVCLIISSVSFFFYFYFIGLNRFDYAIFLCCFSKCNGWILFSLQILLLPPPLCNEMFSLFVACVTAIMKKGFQELYFSLSIVILFFLPENGNENENEKSKKPNCQ